MAWWKAGVAIAVGIALAGCADLERSYRSVETVPLVGPPAAVPDTRCEAEPRTPPPYDLINLRDCTAGDTLIVFAFSGGGIRSAAFGYGALQAAHGTAVPDHAGSHALDRDIDIVSGVSGGSFTAAAFATHHGDLFPAPGAPDHYRDNFLTHNFFADLAAIYLEPWHWQWMLPDYSSQDEMAKIYSGIPFSSPSDTLFAPAFGALAMKGRPLLMVQATDFGNEQPFTFTQFDFDLICSDVNAYPVGNAVAASSAFPVLFQPIRLTNHHFDSRPTPYCAKHRPAWVDEVLSKPEPADLSRLYARASVVDGYLPPRPGAPKKTTKIEPPRHVFLQDGGVTDNVALRGLTNMMIANMGETADAPWTDGARERACKGGWAKVNKILVVAVDGEAQPNNTVSSLPYLSDLSLILNVTGSALIDANGFETMLATDAATKLMARRLAQISCGGIAAGHPVKAYFARVSFQDLAEETVLKGPDCGRDAKDTCTMGDLARSETSLDFSAAQVDALTAAGRDAFRCNRKITEFLNDLGATPASGPVPVCRTPLQKAVVPP